MTLLERAAEIRAASDVLASAHAGQGRLLLVEGPPGAGKTSLMALVADLAREQGMETLRARGGELERDVPYGIIGQLLAWAGDAYVDAGAASLAAPAFGSGGQGRDVGRPAVQHGLYWLVADLAARRPLALLVDDAQWSDLPSLHALVYLARRLEGLELAIVVAIRDGEPDGPDELLDALRREPGAIRSQLEPLTSHAVAEIVRQSLGAEATDRFAHACWEASGGNPFLLTELLRALEAQDVVPRDEHASRVAALGARGAARSILALLRRLGPGAVAVARAVAVLEPDAELDHIAALARLDVGKVTAACERLIAAEVLSDATPLEFTHPLLKAAVYEDLSAPRRARLHLEAARVLHDVGRESVTIAPHLMRCPPGNTDWIRDVLRDAARDALARGAPATAVEQLRRARAETSSHKEELDVREELGVAMLAASDGRGVDELLAVREARGDPLHRAGLAMLLAQPLGLRGREDEGARILSESLAELPDEEQGLRAHLLGERYVWATGGGLVVDRAQLLRDVANTSDATLGERHFLVIAAFRLALGLGRRDEIVRVVDRLTRDASLLREDAAVGFAHPSLALPLVACGRGGDALAFLDQQSEAARRRGAMVAIALATSYRAAVLLARGDLTEADAEAATARRLLVDLGLGKTLPVATIVLALVRVERGEPDAAAALVDEDGLGEQPPGSLLAPFALVARGRVRSATGHHTDARTDFLTAGRLLAALPYPDALLLGWRVRLALAEHALGRAAEAREAADEALAAAREAAVPYGMAETLRVAGTVGGRADAIEVLHEAARIAGDSDAPLLHAKALVELGSALRRARFRRESRDPLRVALDLAHRCGARPLEDRARTELAATGARPRRVLLTGREALTPSELRTARLASTGMTNREVAQELFVTAKTVETQLRAAYRKLDITGRGELAAALSR